jgi:hypothetical protein
MRGFYLAGPAHLAATRQPFGFFCGFAFAISPGSCHCALFPWLQRGAALRWWWCPQQDFTISSQSLLLKMGNCFPIIITLCFI